ncbi:MAG: hypothetical protein IKG65_08495 [Exiguobacterium sp.]|nr:hypothetical protein [Exiguobacterium sp.]MBR2758840.1 hypothetical protein [Exiguobacterium sp.]MBR3062428.1 hypothetical protein [Exiguobacterium sp.]MBR3216121.1 hypothetical protein [Exiguobacterium sp.]
MDYKMLHEKFERRKQWLIFDKEEVVRRVMVRYKARIIPYPEDGHHGLGERRSTVV